MAFLRACEDHGVKVWIRHVLMEARVEEGSRRRMSAREGTHVRSVRGRIGTNPNPNPNPPTRRDPLAAA